MLELRNISKIYKTKAQTVRALDNVNLYFEETGMVFITGKSGSGKTTLLNVIGGLDNFEEGELIIKDKSTKEFTKADYDSYRNTYIGFIFQEYNLLDNLTIEKNLSLATELQGKKHDPALIDEILAKVDLEDVKKRKPQELSGGQRQRVAIARALIKNPAIIMADEPTGALDSANGLQIMDLLKKLSSEKLVIVVSHDLELANKYADRIINLVDGRIDSDTTITVNEKTRRKVAKNADGLVIKNGAKLNEKDLIKIKSAVEQGKKVSITDNIGRKRTKTKNQQHKEYGETEFIKTRMNPWDTIKMGFGALKTKVFRLIVTILLCSISFSIFGVFDSMAIYDEHRLAVNTLNASLAPSITFTSKIEEPNGKSYGIDINEDLINSLQNQSHYAINGVYSSYYMGIGTPSELRNSVAARISKYYQYTNINGAVEFDEEELAKYHFEMLYGNLPTAYDEIAIPEYYAYCLMNWGYRYKNDEGEEVFLDDISELVNPTNPMTLEFGTTGAKATYKIVGIVRTGEINKKFDSLLGKKGEETDKYDQASTLDQNEFKNYIQNGYFLYIFTKPGFAENAMKTYNTAPEYTNTAYRFRFDIADTFPDGENQISKEITKFFLYDDVKELDQAHYFFDETKTELDKNEILLDVSQYTVFFNDLIDKVDQDARAFVEAQSGDYLQVQTYLDAVATAKQTISNKQISANEKIEAIQSFFTNDNGSISEIMNIIYKDQEVPTLQDILGRTLTLSKLDPTKYTSNSTSLETVKVNDDKFKIVGFYAGVKDAASSAIVVNKETFNNLGIDLNQGVYSKMIATNLGGGNINTLCSLLYSSQGLTFETVNLAFSMIKANPDFFQNLSLIFLIASLIFAVFSIVMFSNFISTSIRDKYTEIGVLRALGAKGSDVLKIFIIESVIIALINAVSAIIVASIGSMLVNIFLCNYLNLFIPLSTYGIRQVLIIFGLSLLVGVISATIPIARVSKQKPVETIRRAFD